MSDEQHVITVEPGHGAYLQCTCGWTGCDTIGPHRDETIEAFYAEAMDHLRVVGAPRERWESWT